jgi:hypothetical protein
MTDRGCHKASHNTSQLQGEKVLDHVLFLTSLQEQQLRIQHLRGAWEVCTVQTAVLEGSACN